MTHHLHHIERVTFDPHCVKVNIRPLSPKEFAHPQAGSDFPRAQGAFFSRSQALQHCCVLVRRSHHGEPSLRFFALLRTSAQHADGELRS